MSNIVVVGAGVSGLTTALLLSRNPRYNVTVIAKHMPGDFDIEYTSPWAGANVLPMSDVANSKYERNTWPEMARLAKEVPDAGVHFQKTFLYNRDKDPVHLGDLNSTTPWWSTLFPDFRVLTQSSLPSGFDTGTTFTSVCINLAIYLPWLVSQCLLNGVVFKRAVLKHISDANSLHHSASRADLIVNCTGIMASKLGGVMDQDLVPIRGITVLVRNEADGMYATSGTDEGDDQLVYIMQRAAGGGTILGGTYQKGNWDSQTDHNQAVKIMQRVVEICPALTGGQGIDKLDVIRVGVGLRPFRTNGLRLEKEKIDGTWVVHNYGHSGWGYQASYGCSQEVKEIVDGILESKAKL